MKQRYLEITYRNGKPLAAYLYLPRRDDAPAVRTEEGAPGLLVDFAVDGRPIGIEITAPSRLMPADLNALLTRLHQPTLPPADLGPLNRAA